MTLDYVISFLGLTLKAQATKKKKKIIWASCKLKTIVLQRAVSMKSKDNSYNGENICKFHMSPVYRIFIEIVYLNNK